MLSFYSSDVKVGGVLVYHLLSFKIQLTEYKGETWLSVTVQLLW